MKYLGYVWSVIINLIVLLVISAIFNVADTKSEKLLFSILVLIYLNIIYYFTLMITKNQTQQLG